MVELGKIYKDEFTGFSGIATARTEFLYGCVRVCLESKKLDKEGKPLEIWFDEQRLVTKTKASGPGGPGPNPPKRDPVRF